MMRFSHKSRAIALLAGVAVSMPAIGHAQYENDNGEPEFAESTEVTQAPIQKPQRIEAPAAPAARPQRIEVIASKAETNEAAVAKPERVKVVEVQVPVAVPVPASPGLASPRPPAPSWDEALRQPYIEREPNYELIAGGTLLFVSAYGFSAMTASASPVAADEHLFIPVVGPWLDLAERPRCDNIKTHPACETEGANKAMLVASGLTQSLGVLLVLGGVLFPKLTIVDGRQAKVELLPEAGPTIAGLMTRGHLGF